MADSNSVGTAQGLPGTRQADSPNTQVCTSLRNHLAENVVRYDPYCQTEYKVINLPSNMQNVGKRKIATTFRQRDERWYRGSDFEEGQALGRDLTGMWNCA